MLTFDTLFIMPIPATEIVRQAARNIAKQILIFTYVYCFKCYREYTIQ